MVTETDILEAMTGSIIVGDWWINVAAIESDGVIYVTVENPEGEFGSYIRKEFTMKELLDVYNSMPPDARLHCGGDDIISSPDACSFDRIMQWAFFGELVFA